MGRALSRGDRPTEPSYSWLPENWIGVQPPGFSIHRGLTPTDALKKPRELIKGGTAPLRQDTTFPGG